MHGYNHLQMNVLYQKIHIFFKQNYNTMLINLDNEVHFKKVFTDVEVFTGFVKDILNIDLHITKVETEKNLQAKVGAIKFRMDLFAEDTASRTVVEIQKVDYDYSYDRFTHYFLGNLIDIQRSSKAYAFGKDVYIIVILTTSYRVKDKRGNLIKDDVLLTDVNPRTLEGEMRHLYNHKLLILNPTNIKNSTPQAIKDWMELIRESIKNPENPHLNLNNPAIAKAAMLAEKESITPEEIAEAKIQEMKKEALASAVGDLREEMQEVIEQKDQALAQKDQALAQKDQALAAAQNKLENAIKKALQRDKLSEAEIAEDYEVTIEFVQAIKNQLNH